MDELNSLLKFKGLTKLDVSNTAITDLSDLALVDKSQRIKFLWYHSQKAERLRYTCQS